MVDSERDDKIKQLKAETKEWGKPDNSDPGKVDLQKNRARLIEEIAELNVPIQETQRNKRMKRELGKYVQQRRARGSNNK